MMFSEKSEKQLFILIGAGFSKPLGFPITNDMANIVKILLNVERKPLDEVVSEISEYLQIDSEDFKKDVKRFLTFCMYADTISFEEAKKRKEDEKERYLKTITKVFGKKYGEIYSKVINDFHIDYDYLAFKSIGDNYIRKIRSGSLSGNFDLQDFLTLLNFLYDNNITVFSEDVFPTAKESKQVYDHRPHRIFKALMFFR